MAIKPFKKLNADRLIGQVQDNIDATFMGILNSDIIDGLLLTNIVLDSTKQNSINHKLNRKLKGFVVVRRNAQSEIWDAQDTNTLPDKILILECSAPVTISLWVF